MFGTSLLAVLQIYFLVLVLKKNTDGVEGMEQHVPVKENGGHVVENSVTILEDDNESDFLEPLVEEDFPVGPYKEPLIPHIIHQTYKDEQIPSDLTKYVKSMQEKNPNWKYYFWTDSSARKLVVERYPQFLEMYDGYISPINRADAIRYIILYEFGGFYGDLDVEIIRPLDILTYKYSCIFPPEPFEQAVFRLKAPYFINNAIMMCRPKHPFLRYMIDSLHQYQHMIGQLDIAGPAFVTSMFIRYNNIQVDQLYQRKISNDSNSPYFYKGTLPENDTNAVYVPNTKYFINSLSQDWMNEKHYQNICGTLKNKRDIEKRACNELNRRLRPNNRRKYAFTDHHWDKSYYDKKHVRRTFQPLKTVITNYSVY